MRRKLENIGCLLVLLFFASCFSGNATPTETKPCETQIHQAKETITIPVKDTLDKEQVERKVELRNLLTSILRDDSSGITDLKKYRRLKHLASKIKPPHPSMR
jgi:alkyl sulfatase BDS1-like metallo-beta-lactamase superfamily hydrolase